MKLIAIDFVWGFFNFLVEVGNYVVKLADILNHIVNVPRVLVGGNDPKDYFLSSNRSRTITLNPLPLSLYPFFLTSNFL